jgi:hypothetical protein
MEAGAGPPPGKEPFMRVFRLFAVLVLLLALGASGAAASPASRPAGVPEEEPFAFHVSSLLARLESLLAGVWSKAGCRADPWGRCIESVPTTDEGCRIDPWGRCGSNS